MANFTSFLGIHPLWYSVLPKVHSCLSPRKCFAFFQSLCVQMLPPPQKLCIASCPRTTYLKVIKSSFVENQVCWFPFYYSYLFVRRVLEQCRQADAGRRQAQSNSTTVSMGNPITAILKEWSSRRPPQLPYPRDCSIVYKDSPDTTFVCALYDFSNNIYRQKLGIHQP